MELLQNRRDMITLLSFDNETSGKQVFKLIEKVKEFPFPLLKFYMRSGKFVGSTKSFFLLNVDNVVQLQSKFIRPLCTLTFGNLQNGNIVVNYYYYN